MHLAVKWPLYNASEITDNSVYTTLRSALRSSCTARDSSLTHKICCSLRVARPRDGSEWRVAVTWSSKLLGNLSAEAQCNLPDADPRKHSGLGQCPLAGLVSRLVTALDQAAAEDL